MSAFVGGGPRQSGDAAFASLRVAASRTGLNREERNFEMTQHIDKQITDTLFTISALRNGTKLANLAITPRCLVQPREKIGKL